MTTEDDLIGVRENLHDALGVLTQDVKIRAWLADNDPKALEQADAAFKLSQEYESAEEEGRAMDWDVAGRHHATRGIGSGGRYAI